MSGNIFSLASLCPASLVSSHINNMWQSCWTVCFIRVIDTWKFDMWTLIVPTLYHCWGGYSNVAVYVFYWQFVMYIFRIAVRTYELHDLDEGKSYYFQIFHRHQSYKMKNRIEFWAWCLGQYWQTLWVDALHWKVLFWSRIYGRYTCTTFCYSRSQICRWTMSIYLKEILLNKY